MLYSCLNNISNVGTKLFTSNYQLTEENNKSDLVLVRSYNMHDYIINENLLAVARAGSGVNNIPLNDFAEKGVVVFNTPGANANGVKELVITGMLLASRDIVNGINWVNEHKDDVNILKSIEKAKKAFAGTEILGKTITVIGLGAVGGRVANACRDLGMKVYGYDPYISEKAMSQLKSGIEIENDLNKLYPKSDFISLHLPLLGSTKHFFNDEVFAKIKKGAVLLNFSRDQLVKNESIKKALEIGIIKKYITDFPNYFVANLENVISIPHLGASTNESEENCAIMAVRQLQEYVEFGNITNSVNYPDIYLGKLLGNKRLIILARKYKDTILKINELLKPYMDKITMNTVKSNSSYMVLAYDFSSEFPNELLNQLKEIDAINKIRII